MGKVFIFCVLSDFYTYMTTLNFADLLINFQMTFSFLIQSLKQLRHVSIHLWEQASENEIESLLRPGVK